MYDHIANRRGKQKANEKLVNEKLAPRNRLRNESFREKSETKPMKAEKNEQKRICLAEKCAIRGFLNTSN